MHEQEQRAAPAPPYPVGRGYGHDYMRGGEVFGGYGYADRPEYERRRGDAPAPDTPALDGVSHASPRPADVLPSI